MSAREVLELVNADQLRDSLENANKLLKQQDNTLREWEEQCKKYENEIERLKNKRGSETRVKKAARHAAAGDGFDD